MEFQDGSGHVIELPDDHPGTIAIKEHLEQVEEAIRRAEKDNMPIIQPLEEEELECVLEGVVGNEDDLDDFFDDEDEE